MLNSLTCEFLGDLFPDLGEFLAVAAPVRVELDHPDLLRVVNGGRQVGGVQLDHAVLVVVERLGLATLDAKRRRRRRQDQNQDRGK